MVKRESGAHHVLATFRVPSTVIAETVHVVGEFNDWDRTANPMVRGDKGFEALVALEPGRAYRFRYLLDGQRWENDWDADGYVPNEFGGDDSVIDLTDATLASPLPTEAAPSGAGAAAYDSKAKSMAQSRPLADKST